jgi:DNA-binding transcriptional MerR regulator
VYGNPDVRRIALVQLLQNTALMSLPEISALLAASGKDRDWRTVVQARVDECEDQLARLTTARAYLAHLLSRPSGHPTDQCPYLAEEIDVRLCRPRAFAAGCPAG